jgi:hypothetical protein
MTTAVLRLIEQLEGEDSKIARVIGLKKYNSIIKEALEMEKEQMIEFACQVAEASAMKYIQGKTTRMIAEELLTFK